MVAVGPDLYAVSYPNGVKKSTNGGTAWTPVNTGLPSSGSNVFCESVGWNGTYLFAGTQSGVYRSNDGGASWTNANGTLTASSTVFANKWFVNAGVTMAIFSASVSAGGGIWRTDNNGSTWFIGHSGMGSNVVVHAITLDGATLYASTSTGLYTSTDNGLSWAAHATVNYATFGLQRSGSNLVILSNFGYRYSSNGTTWNDATGDPTAPTAGELTIYDGILYANTRTSTGCLKSTDDGMSWTATTGFGAVDQSSLEEFCVSPSRLYVTALFDIYYINSLGTGVIAGAPLVHLPAYPTCFTTSFDLEAPANATTLQWIDATGRAVRTDPIVAGRCTLARERMPSGTYRLRMLSSTGTVLAAGTVVAY